MFSFVVSHIDNLRCFLYRQEGSFEKGQLHGTRRWLATESATTENTRPKGVHASVWKSEMDYVHGKVVGIRHFNREGERVLPSNGEPYPARPETPRPRQSFPGGNRPIQLRQRRAADPAGEIARLIAEQLADGFVAKPDEPS